MSETDIRADFFAFFGGVCFSFETFLKALWKEFRVVMKTNKYVRVFGHVESTGEKKK